MTWWPSLVWNRRWLNRTLLTTRAQNSHSESAEHFWCSRGSSSSALSWIDATDLFSLNTVLGTSIEAQVVNTLNRMRSIWHPDERWVGYRFERQAQTFPDVRLVRRGSATSDIAMGIELKGWYLLSKEGVPSLRFQTTPAACSEFNLIAVVPWHLSNVLSGTPVAREPWLDSARHAAEFRNHWWQHVRETSGRRAITSPVRVHPYS